MGSSYGAMILVAVMVILLAICLGIEKTQQENEFREEFSRNLYKENEKLKADLRNHQSELSRKERQLEALQDYVKEHQGERQMQEGEQDGI